MRDAPCSARLPTARRVRERWHAQVKVRLDGAFESVRKAFRYFDKDASGSITPDEVVQGLMDLNVNVPRHLLEHLVNGARDGNKMHAPRSSRMHAPPL